MEVKEKNKITDKTILEKAYGQGKKKWEPCSLEVMDTEKILIKTIVTRE